MLSQHIVSRAPTELYFFHRKICFSIRCKHTEWLELWISCKKEVDVSAHVSVCFQEKFGDIVINLKLMYSSECAQCNNRVETFPHGGENLENGYDKFSQGCGEFVSCSRHLTKDNISSPFITEIDFRFENVYNLYAFGIRYQCSFCTTNSHSIYYNYN